MSKLIDEMGNRYGRLVVVKRGKNRGRQAMWLCKCDCGKETIVSGAHLRRGNTRSCGCLRTDVTERGMGNFIDETGKRYGRLLVISREESDYYGFRWLCKCECGNETIVRGIGLRRGTTRSCGCLVKENSGWAINRLAKGEAAFNALVCSIKYGAKTRNLKYSLTNEQVRQLTKQPCFYCGELPSSRISGKGYNGEYVYNGIDRLDNNKGYVEGNVVTSCVECNKAKGTRSQQEFSHWIEKVYNHTRKEVT